MSAHPFELEPATCQCGHGGDEHDGFFWYGSCEKCQCAEFKETE